MQREQTMQREQEVTNTRRTAPATPLGPLPDEAETPIRHRSKKARNPLVALVNFALTLVVMGAVAFFGVVWWGKAQFEQAGPLAEPASVIVERGEGWNDVVPKLVARGVIPPQGALKVFTRGVEASGQSRALKAGEFGFEPGASMREVMLAMTEGKAIVHKVTFPEGWTVWRMWERLARDDKLTGDLPEMPLEGSLLPATYTYTRGQSRAAIVQQMRDAMDQAIKAAWDGRASDLPIETPRELVTLASIIEKETALASERPQVASVFVNRLRRNMRLQTDPTIIYGIWGGQGKPSGYGGLRRSDLNRKTDYNTYQIRGLPPGPIANPGRDSLLAAARPADTNSLYFVAKTTTPSDGHLFAETLREHNRNVALYRKAEAARDAAAGLMGVQSMTGFAEVTGEAEGESWTWVIRSGER